MKRVRAEFRRRWTLLLHTTGLPAAADRRVARRVLRSGATRMAPIAKEHLVISAPGDGNIGDQALFEALVEGTSGPVVAITRYPDDIALPQALSDRVRLVAMPDLVYGQGGAHAVAVAQLTRMIANAQSLSIIGADIMDGRYSLRGSVRRATIAEIGALAGVDTRIVGFSWNAAPRFAARRAMVRASGAGAVPFVRDPRSAERAERDGILGVELAADVVFSTARRESSPESTPRPYAILNVSGLIARTGDHTSEYVHITEHLRDRGFHVVILPHVVKPLSDDLEACSRLVDRVGDDGVTFVRCLLTPTQIRDLAAGADITVTGRMHLAIMSLSVHTPAVALATQGKVEGLMELFGTPELCVSPIPGFGRAVIEAINLALPAGSPIRTLIDGALPSVTELAKRNSRGLGMAVPAGSAPVDRMAH